MIRKEIRDLKLNIGDESVLVKSPFSVYSALGANKCLHNDLKVRVTTVLRVDSNDLKSKRHALIVRGAKGRFGLYLNEEIISECESGENLYFDLTGKISHGDNPVELRMLDEGEELLSSGVFGAVGAGAAGFLKTIAPLGMPFSSG